MRPRLDGSEQKGMRLAVQMKLLDAILTLEQSYGMAVTHRGPIDPVHAAVDLRWFLERTREAFAER